MRYSNLTKKQREWIAELQRMEDRRSPRYLGNLRCDLNTGEIESVDYSEFNPETSTRLGCIPLKAIPHRARLIREREEERQRGLELKEQLEREKRLEERELVLSLNDRNPKLESRFNIHPGKIYRVIVAGSNPLDTLTYDGILEKFNGRTHIDGCFSINSILLENGFSYVPYSVDRTHFNRKEIFNSDCGRFQFGRVLDEEGFRRILGELVLSKLNSESRRK